MKNILLIAIFLSSIALPIPSRAVQVIAVTVTNASGMPAADLHLTFSGTGGDIFVDPNSVVAVGCPIPNIPSNSTTTNTIVIEWGAACIAPDAAVTFIAHTQNGPLAFESGYWSDIAGNNIGDVSLTATPPHISITPIPSPWPPMLPFGAIKFQSYSVGGEQVYTPWRLANAGLCWGRWCWRKEQWFFTRLVFCPFPNRFFRLFEIPVWIPVTPWVHSGHNPEKCRREEITIPLPDLGPPPGGPRPNPPKPGPGNIPPLFAPWLPGLAPGYSDDGLRNIRPAADFTSTFLAVHEALDIKGDLQSPPDVDLFKEMGKGYPIAKDALSLLLNEVNEVNSFEPNPLLDSIAVALESMQTAFQEIGDQLASGLVLDPSPFQELASAITVLKNQISGLPYPRFANPADNLTSMAEALTIAANQVQAGLNNPVNMSAFIWAVYVQFRSMLYHFATGMMPHIRLKVKLENWIWYPSTIDAVQVKILSSDNQDLLAEGIGMPPAIFPLSGRSELDIPVSIQEGSKIRIWYKLPTHLSDTIAAVFTDGLKVESTTAIVPGDVNGDDCIDMEDLILVQNSLGIGGINADSIPSSDVNGDGLVDGFDLDIVSSNMGKCGVTVSSQTPAETPNDREALEIHPNPLTSTTTIGFNLLNSNHVQLKVINLLGKEIGTLISTTLPAGKHQVEWQPGNLPKGIYFFTLQAGAQVQTRAVAVH